MHFSKEEVLPELEVAVGDVAMETSWCGTDAEGSSSLGTPHKSEASSACAVEGINQSILSLLVKLMSIMTSATSSPGRLVICVIMLSTIDMIMLIHS